VFFIDLDGFKAVNDELGHEVGDDVLKEAATRLAGCVRKSDTVARLGGDEFTAIIEDIDGPGAAALVAQKMLDQLARPFCVGRHAPSVSASIGIARYPADSNDAVDLVKMADEAMYQAKRSGKNAYRMNA
jgi:diguanylate cyclase (GGDEF)-like protein